MNINLCNTEKKLSRLDKIFDVEDYKKEIFENIELLQSDQLKSLAKEFLNNFSEGLVYMAFDDEGNLYIFTKNDSLIKLPHNLNDQDPSIHSTYFASSLIYTGNPSDYSTSRLFMETSPNFSYDNVILLDFLNESIDSRSRVLKS